MTTFIMILKIIRNVLLMIVAVCTYSKIKKLDNTETEDKKIQMLIDNQKFILWSTMLIFLIVINM